MSEKIKIVTGKIQTGKTTKLFMFANSHKSVDGILQPIVNDKRKLYHISSRTIKEFEIDDQGNETFNIGRYYFSKESFNWANEKIIDSFNKTPEWLILDEIGKLELEEKGFHSSINKILGERKNKSTKIILVIRDYLLDKALDFYKINNGEYEVMNL